MAEERLMSISSSSHLAPDDVARHSFSTARRGFDPGEVRAYLESIAAGLRGIAEQERQLLSELADAEHRAAHPVLDEPTLTAALGTETARVLHSAHEVAAEMVAKSEAEAHRLTTEAREEIQQSRAEGEARLAEQTAESEAAIEQLRHRTEQQAVARLEAARQDAEELLGQAREQCQSMVDEAQGLRSRVLADLSKRRKVLHAQIEQLRAGRERLAGTVQDVRQSIDVIADDLFAAEDNARLAAEAAGREALDRPEEGTPEELASLLLAEETEARAAANAGAATSDEAPAPVDFEDLVEAASDEAGKTQQPEVEVPEPAPLVDSSVDVLFARIRAARDDSDSGDGDSRSGEPAGDDVARVAGDAGTGAGTADGTEDADGVDGTEDADGADGAGGHPHGVESPDRAEGSVGEASVREGTDGEVGDGMADGPPEPRSPFALRRDEMIGPIVKALARRLKRTLQDSQNELLDGLRSNGSRWSADLLPETTEHLDAYSTAALPVLEEASEAGASFAGTGAAGGPPTEVLLGIAHGLAEEVVVPLRRRLSDDQGLAEADESVAAEHVGSAFREWKGERIERLSGDFVVAAFSAGTIAAAEAKKSAELEWIAVPGSGDDPCPDCEDNGLNGSQQPGREFPTGHPRPPAHPGCRCLLALSAT
ncbi:MAG TPA: DivIVA domain-containing protein [Acidimicrobiales bacterium]